jgi:uncharacterized membrane protein
VTGIVVAADRITRPLTRESGPIVGIASAAVVGGALAALRYRRMERRTAHLAAIDEPSNQVESVRASARSVLRSTGVGAGVGAGLLALAGTEFAIAEGTSALVSRVIGRAADPVTPLVGHTVAAATLVPIAAWALNRIRRRVEHADDIVEPAYPTPPANPHVTAGPRSVVAFDGIGKEGRRFVLMALDAEAITAVMGEAAQAPIRAVAGFESAATAAGRARVALEELEALGAYDRSIIVVAAPTGVGYVNYSFAEALEYLARGDCAIVVPQYALVPSALALDQTRAGVQMQTLILAGIRDRIAAMPPERRPRLLQFGESLGAQVALDVAAQGTHRFDELGLEGGLYLGTPFLSRLWTRWFEDAALADPQAILGSVSQADQIPGLASTVRHIQVIHHDDPINKFSFDSVVREPWWMGPAALRPPGVPRETEFRPVISFILTLVDLKNGMQSKPGEFVRVGHDYRIELCDAIRHAYRLGASPEQVERIEQALRDREREWAARRMVARRFASARASVQGQLQKWGVDPAVLGIDEASMDSLARGDVTGMFANLGTSGPGI